MELRPYRYRVEHHEPGQPPRVLGAFLTFAAGTKALLLAAQQLTAAERAGHVALVDQASDPELVVETYTMPVSEPTEPAT